MKRTYHIAVLLASLLPVSCEKELDMNYRSIDPLYVVEGMINERETRVLITTTRDMNDTGDPVAAGNLTVRLSDDRGNSETLVFVAEGYYVSGRGTSGVPGTAYTLNISDGEDEFVSVSLMHDPGAIGPMTFAYRPELTERYILCSMSIEDVGDVINYYCLRLYKNGRQTLRQILNDRGRDGGEIPVIVPIRFSLEEQIPPEEGEMEEDNVFREGDRLDIELQTIDRTFYDYIYSLELGGTIAYNPTDTFSGDCLGYFSAYSSDIYSAVFDPTSLVDPDLP